MELHVCRDGMACRRVWHGMWVEMARRVQRWSCVWAEMVRRVGRDGAGCGRRWCDIWAGIAWRVDGNGVACGLRWRGLSGSRWVAVWAEMAWRGGRQRGCGLWAEIKLRVGGA